ncbi:malate dehydrogenase (quinone) [Corynebacterium sphenisci]|uniref:malate dehydrogenase (quinone) n=1 Tax=Corynebacterium sphenisci TaxID=191493 RepID=UPI0026DF6D65|nr:malate dehydrogenase (quinone) [Corynebacterium sphenisci]MDO5731358.1 malate dehydrogenase (quinone) [Corynebacterium sphenisci]
MSQKNLPAKVGDEVDVALIGAGIMSATLGVLLKELEPAWSQIVLERLDAPAAESSSPWNNAGTGHSALCELNYTPEKRGQVDVTKALNINEQFQVSRQLWSYLVSDGVLTDPREFINPVDHTTFAQGEDQIHYMRRRYEALKEHPLFFGQELIEDNDRWAEYLPLMAEGRDFSTPVSSIRNTNGTDVNFGALTRQYLASLSDRGTEVRYGHVVTDLTRDGRKWVVTVKNRHTGDTRTIRANFVFVGAGGNALPLLQKAKIPEIRGYGGFPVSGQWLRCTNEELIGKHNAKVYGKASVGAPPMSVPHLDTRVIDGKRGLMFGPYAGWTPKFLKTGSNLDLVKALRPHNLPSMLGVGFQELGLTKYLIEEVLKNFSARMDALREYVPAARDEDWELINAGQRVQVIAPAKAPKFGSLEFGTAVVNSADGSIAGLMGASPGASIAPAVMIKLIERCFGPKMGDWAPKIKNMVPSYGVHLSEDTALFKKVWADSEKTLKLDR